MTTRKTVRLQHNVTGAVITVVESAAETLAASGWLPYELSTPAPAPTPARKKRTPAQNDEE